MSRLNWRLLLKNKFAAAGLLLLALMYMAAIFAGFLSPYSPTADEFRSDFLHPPSSLGLDRNGLYVKEAGMKHPVRFLVHRWRYRILWFFESDLHLFGTDNRPVFLLGTDQLGRDLFSRILFGAQISLSIGFIGVILTTLFGLFFGGIAGYYGGKMDAFVMRFAEVLMSIPALYLILTLRNVIPHRLQDSYDRIQEFAMGTFAWQKDPYLFSLVMTFIVILLSYYNYSKKWRKGILAGSVLLLVALALGPFWFRWVSAGVQEVLPGNTYLSTQWTYLILVVILSTVGWAGMSRVVRGMVLSLREQEYVIAAKALGSSDSRVLWHHILPNLFGYVIVRSTLLIPAYILGEVSLSFLGLGIQEPIPSWGNMLSAAQDLRVLESYTWILSPGFFLFLTVLSFNFLGDGLRDALDPRARGGG